MTIYFIAGFLIPITIYAIFLINRFVLAKFKYPHKGDWTYSFFCPSCGSICKDKYIFICPKCGETGEFVLNTTRVIYRNCKDSRGKTYREYKDPKIKEWLENLKSNE